MLELDGKPLLPGAGVVGFSNTGGWCRTTDDWNYFQVMEASDEPALVRLTAGKHRLRMARITGSMNIDLFAWEPVE